MGTIAAAEKPPVILTSNRTRALHDALRRRCLLSLDPLSGTGTEAAIIQARAGDVTRSVANAVARLWPRCGAGRSQNRRVSRSGRMARAATLLESGSGNWPLAFRQAVGAAIKDEEDLLDLREDLDGLLAEACA